MRLGLFSRQVVGDAHPTDSYGQLARIRQWSGALGGRASRRAAAQQELRPPWQGGVGGGSKLSAVWPLSLPSPWRGEGF